MLAILFFQKQTLKFCERNLEHIVNLKPNFIHEELIK